MSKLYKTRASNNAGLLQRFVSVRRVAVGNHWQRRTSVGVFHPVVCRGVIFLGSGGVAVVRAKINQQNREAQFLSLVTKTGEVIFMLRIVCKIVLWPSLKVIRVRNLNFRFNKGALIGCMFRCSTFLRVQKSTCKRGKHIPCMSYA